ncbi:MAG: sigma-70 family RNA polymerase sigma factor [Planctomycetota bacterium]|jgi:RNA polymerase sigma factor (sigma-70 family)
MPETSEAALIAAILAGSEAAFGELIDRYEGRIVRLLGRFTRDASEVEDLAQEVFIKVFRKLHTFQQDSGLYTWIYRIAVNTANDELSRSGRRRLRLVEDDATLDASLSERRQGDGAAEPLLEEEVRRATREVLDDLPEKYRTILVLREYEDLAYHEMAEVLGISMGTVESRLFRARQRFKDALHRRYPELVPGSRHEGRTLRRGPAEGER